MHKKACAQLVAFSDLCCLQEVCWDWLQPSACHKPLDLLRRAGGCLAEWVLLLKPRKTHHKALVILPCPCWSSALPRKNSDKFLETTELLSVHRPRFGNLHCRRSSRISPSFHNRDRQVVGINKGDGELESLQSKQFSFVQLPRSSSVPSDTTSPGGRGEQQLCLFSWATF